MLQLVEQLGLISRKEAIDLLGGSDSSKTTAVKWLNDNHVQPYMPFNRKNIYYKRADIDAAINKLYKYQPLSSFVKEVDDYRKEIPA